MAARRPHTPASRTHSTHSISSDHPPDIAGFAELGVPAALVAALADVGVTQPFPIQAATLPDSLAGRDVLGRGRTGSGKTYAFALPVLARLSQSRTPTAAKRPRALILAPTRELASQINASLSPLARGLGLRTMTVFGGVPANQQISRLAAGVDIVVACPGRLADHIKAGHASLDAVEITVIDEADHMADLGFLPEVRRLLDKTPARGQRMLFSATLDAAVDVLVTRYLSNPVTHSVDSVTLPVAAMDHHVLHVDRGARIPVLVDLASAPGRTLVFTRTKHGARQLARALTAAGVPSVDLHGNLSQQVRTRNLTAFSDGSAMTMVATDIAARGIHVDDVALVVHADPPIEHKAYLHRSGRTARAGASGTVVTLITDAQAADVRALTRKAGIKPMITRVGAGHPRLAEIAPGERLLVHTPPASISSVDDAGRGRGGPRNRRRSGRGRSATASTASRKGASTNHGRSAGGGSGWGGPRGGSAAASSGSSSAASFSGGMSRRRSR